MATMSDYELKREKRFQKCCDRVEAYMKEAVDRIEVLRPPGRTGYVIEDHPELIAAFVQAAVRLEIYEEEYIDWNQRMAEQ